MPSSNPFVQALVDAELALKNAKQALLAASTRTDDKFLVALLLSAAAQVTASGLVINDIHEKELFG